ncbi:MAG: tetratricopeptide repeat protein [Pyrinomonadaceae bacterium]
MNTKLADDKTNEVLVEELAEEGNSLAEKSDFGGAIKKFEQALAIVPDPKNEQEASLWLYASIGDMYFLKDDFENSAENFYNALNCPDGQVNGFVHLRLGEDLFELEVKEKSLDHLLKAYMLEGSEIFAGENEKYFGFLNRNVELK